MKAGTKFLLQKRIATIRFLQVEQAPPCKRKYYTKGISPLLAAVLLIAATVVTTTMLSGWVSTTMSTTQNTVTNKTNEGVACAAAEIVIDDVYSGAGSNSSAYAIVRNSGNTDNLALTNSQLYDKFGNNFTTTNALPTSLNRGQMATLTFKNTVLPGTTNDSSHDINNGTLVNGASYTLTGKYGSAMRFDGINDYVNVSNSASLNSTTSAVTIEAWIYASSLSTDPVFVDKYGANSLGSSYYLQALGNGTIEFGSTWNATNTSSWLRSGVSQVTTNSWRHIAGTFDMATDTIVIYNNGIVVATATDKTGNIGLNTRNLLIGAGFTAPGLIISLANGTIDDVAIWNRSLTNAEINTSMNQGPLTVSNTNDLVGYWKFDEGKGILTCPTDFSKVIVTTNCGGVSAEFTKMPKC